MEVVVVLAVVGSEEGLHVRPRTLDCISVIIGFGMDERDGVINGTIRVSLGSDIPIRRPTIADEHGAGFDPVTDNARECLSASVRNGNKKCSIRLALYTAKDPPTLYVVSPMVFSSTELAFVYLNGLVRTAEFLAAALQMSLQNIPHSAIV